VRISLVYAIAKSDLSHGKIGYIKRTKPRRKDSLKVDNPGIDNSLTLEFCSAK